MSGGALETPGTRPMALDLHRTLMVGIILAGTAVLGGASVLAYHVTRAETRPVVAVPEPRLVQALIFRAPGAPDVSEVRNIPTTQAQELDVLSTVGRGTRDESFAEKQEVKPVATEVRSKRNDKKKKRRLAKRMAKRT